MYRRCTLACFEATDPLHTESVHATQSVILAVISTLGQRHPAYKSPASCDTIIVVSHQSPGRVQPLLCSSPCSAACRMCMVRNLNMWCLRRDVPTSKLLVGLDRQHTSPNWDVAAQSLVVPAFSESVCPRNEPQCLALYWSTTARDFMTPCLRSRCRPCSFPRSRGAEVARGWANVRVRVSCCRVACTTIRCAHH